MKKLGPYRSFPQKERPLPPPPRPWRVYNFRDDTSEAVGVFWTVVVAGILFLWLGFFWL